MQWEFSSSGACVLNLYINMDPKHSGNVLKHLEKQKELLMEVYRSMSHELRGMQVEEEMIMRKYYEFMTAQEKLDVPVSSDFCIMYNVGFRIAFIAYGTEFVLENLVWTITAHLYSHQRKMVSALLTGKMAFLQKTSADVKENDNENEEPSEAGALVVASKEEQS
ncbi:hypothetical protein SASPL_146728 [Salvia splendens]|uniref:Uncharacterized protein n=1 Tax=Salvia splendens TaxID=180675 RepID=A0A8X8WEE7_SALSN|nr:hypothetical protein SASPL_146728 [Salvia splendens]